LDILHSFKNIDGETKRAVDGAIWTLKAKEEKLEAMSESSDANSKLSGQHIMISYSWAQKDKMRELGFHLKSLGFKIWLDIEQMEGSVLEKMSEAVEQSSLIIIGLSSAYKESQACRTEANYAYRLKKNVLFVMAEEDYTPKGWLGAMLGNDLWYNPWGPEGFEEVSKRIVEQIRKISGASPPSLPAAVKREESSAMPVGGSPGSPSRAPSSTQVLVPEGSEKPLPKQMQELDQVASWRCEEVCRWLYMNKLEELARPFVFHEIDGASLLQWASLPPPQFVLVFERMKVEKMGLLLRFKRALEGLVVGQVRGRAESWKEEEVVGWLKKEGFGSMAAEAEKRGWDGPLLSGLFALSSSPCFFDACADLGLSARPDQVRLAALLRRLFA